MDFPIAGASRPQQGHFIQLGHQVIPFAASFSSTNVNTCITKTGSQGNNNYYQSNDFNFPLRSVKTSSSSPVRSKVVRFPTISEEGSGSGSSSNSKNQENMNQPVQRIQIQSPVSNNGASSSEQVQPQYRIFKRGEALPPGFTTINFVPQQQQQQGAQTETSVSPRPIEEVSNKNQSCNSQIENTDDSDGGGSVNKADSGVNNGKGKRGPGNRTPISLVADIARFHNVKAEYRLTGETGPPHAPTFTVVLSLGEEQYEAQGPSIKKAQLAAATIALEQTALKTPPPRNQPKKQFKDARNQKRTNWTILRLNALAEELGEKISFTSQPVQILNPFNRADPPAVVAVNIGERVFTAEGPNVNTAKNNAALAALKYLTQQKKEQESAKALENEANFVPEPENLDCEIKSPISIVHEMALKRGLKVSFDIVSEQGPPHMKVFTIKCKVGALECDGEGPTKQQAKKASCENMIPKLKEIPLKQPNLSTLKSLQHGLKAKAKATRKKPTTPVIKEVKSQQVSPISRLLQIAHVRKYKEPEFKVIAQSDGTDETNGAEKSQDRKSKRKKPFFTIEVIVGPYVCQGSGSNKKIAKKAAADAALVLMGYAPTEPQEVTSTNGSDRQDSGSSQNNVDVNSRSSEIKITGARQIVPGVLVLQSEGTADRSTTGTAPTTQEMAKVKATTPAQSTQPTKVLDGIGKLAYLADLLGIAVSYSDFPKKNEFLSVASLGTNPPHVAHGIGPTREEAQNAAAVQILEELSTTGLDSLTSSTNSRAS